MIRYQSTRNQNHAVPSHLAVIQGLAEDGGLFVPSSLPNQIDPSTLLNANYQEIASRIIGSFLDDYTEEEIEKCVHSAYDTHFTSEKVVPVSAAKEGYLMELYHGPTSAFKDVALTILPHLLTSAYRKEQRHNQIVILTATSGDTGKAALSGFADVENTSIIVFYPEVGVSAIQKKQMITSKGKNVSVIAVKGNFDDCQRMVKNANSDPVVLNALNGMTLSSANSINIGRLVPQVVYYYSSYIDLVKNNQIKCGDPVNFVVPTGNFGDILAGYLAKKIGLPVNKLIVASNDNNVLTDFFATGTYSTHRPFHTTISPSMDILISSNLERLLYFATDGDSAAVAKWMQELKDDGSYTIPRELLEKLQSEFSAFYTSEEDCKETIRELYNNENILIDPHTAVACHAFKQYRNETGDQTPTIVLSTASPYKFAQDVLSCISDETFEDAFDAMDALHKKTGVAVPQNLSSIRNEEDRFHESITIEDGMNVIAKHLEEIQNA